jgi:hypothetical protein
MLRTVYGHTFYSFHILIYNNINKLNGGGGGIRTHVRVISPQVDFESTPLRPLRYPSLQDGFQFSVFVLLCCFSGQQPAGRRSRPSASRLKKLLHQLPTLGLPDLARHFQAMVEAGVLRQAVKRHAGAGLWVRGAEHQAPQAGV